MAAGIKITPPNQPKIKPKKMFKVRFYRESSGREPALEWLRDLPKQEREIIGGDLQTLQYRWPIGKPLVAPLEQGLWELRSNLGTRIARLIFVLGHEQLIVVLHGFIKKTQKTPRSDIDLALKRANKL
jgi:phage-related protein